MCALDCHLAITIESIQLAGKSHLKAQKKNGLLLINWLLFYCTWCYHSKKIRFFTFLGFFFFVCGLDAEAKKKKTKNHNAKKRTSKKMD